MSCIDLLNMIANSSEEFGLSVHEKREVFIKLVDEYSDHHRKIVQVFYNTYDKREDIRSIFGDSFNKEFKELILDRDMGKQTDLIRAVVDENYEAAKIVIEKDEINIGAQNKFGETTLIIAIELSNSAIVRLILNTGLKSNPGAQDVGGMTALLTALNQRDVEIAKALLERFGSDTNPGAEGEATTALLVAVERGYYDIIKELLKLKDISPNSFNDEGSTALTVAVESDKIDIVRLLISDPRIDIDYKLRNDFTALHIAVLNNNIDIVKLLISTGRADVNNRLKDTHIEVDYFNEVTMLMAAVSNEYHDMLEVLLAVPNIDLDETNYDDQTAMDIAVEMEDQISINLIKKAIEKKKQDDVAKLYAYLGPVLWDF